MYWGFIIYITIISIIVALIMSHKARVFFIAVIIFALFVYGACALQNIARAEEIRTCFIVDFNLSKGTFILEDEDGFLWEFSLEEDDYALGDEYTLHLDDTPWYE